MTDSTDRNKDLSRKADEQDLPTERKARDGDDDTPNPPRTTTGKMTAPKFGSAGSGGLELEPGPAKN